MRQRLRHGIGRRRARALAGVAAVGGMVAGVGVAGAAQQADATVAVVDTAYQPAAVEIATGDAVTWNINSVQVHNVEGETGPDAGWSAGAYTSELTSNGSASYTFNQPGTYTYFCSAHPAQMKGSVTVEGEPTEPTPPTPSPAPTTTPPPAATPSPSGGTPTTPGGTTTPAPGAGAKDGGAPAVSGLRLKSIRHGARLTFRLSETASVTLRFKRRGSGKVVRTVRLQVRAGTRTINVRGSRLRPGSYTVELEARDAGGNRAPVARAALRITPKRG